MQESDIRDSKILKKYQKLVDKDVKKFFLNITPKTTKIIIPVIGK